MRGIAKTPWVLITTIGLSLLQPLTAEARFAKGTNKMPSEMLVLACRYVAAEISVIPVRADGSKAPATPSWKPYQTRIADENELERMFPPGEERGIAAVCGKVSGNLEVLDFDEPSMHEKFRRLLQQEPGGQALIDKITLLVDTPSGGHHLFYRCGDGVEGGQKLAQRLVVTPDGKSKIVTLIETRGEGNYALLPGSPPSCHSSGKPYQLLMGDFAQIPTIRGTDRQLLLKSARGLNEHNQNALVTREQRKGQGDRPGDHFNRVIKWEDILTPHGWDVVGQNGGTVHWRRPDKDGDGLSATTNHEGSDLLYVFSTNAHPFEAGRGYNKFAAYTMLNHGGDFKAAAAAISTEGEQRPRAEHTSGELDCDDGEEAQPSEKSQADHLVNLALKSGIKLFHDQFQKSHGVIHINNHHETWSLRGQQFRLFLSQLGWQSDKHAFSNDSIGSALNVLDSMARFEGDEIMLHNRVAYHEGSIYYDLADRDWRVIKISCDGWEIVTHPPNLFRRFSHQSAQVEPRRGGKLKDFSRFVNITSDQERLLLWACIVATLVPDIPHPVLIVHGPQGATKTTLLRVLRRLVDPSQTETLTISTDLREFVQLLSHHWCSFFDNVSFMSDWTSDALCRAATGDAFSKRELYSDDEDVIYQFRRCVALNGINVAAHKPDLLDRSVLIGLQSIAPGKRKEERKFWKEFEEARPLLFGAMLTALSEAMVLLPSIKPADLPRMADFAVWGCAIAQALGHTTDDFLAAFNSNSEARNDEVLTSSPIATAIIALVGDKGEFVLSPSSLLERLTERVSQQQAKARDWPKAPHVLTRRIREVITNLAAIGIEVEIGGRTRESRKIKLRKGPSPNVTTSPIPSPSRPEVSSDPDPCDARDALPGSSGCQEASQSSHALPEGPSDKWREKGGR